MQLRPFLAAAASLSIALGIYGCSDSTFSNPLPIYVAPDATATGLADASVPTDAPAPAADAALPGDAGDAGHPDAGDAAPGEAGDAGDTGAPDAEHDAPADADHPG